MKHLEHTEPHVVLDRLKERHPRYRVRIASIWLAQLDEASGQVHTVRDWPLRGIGRTEGPAGAGAGKASNP
jgi:hypothetical protein